MLALCCGRLADDWNQAYGHPVLVAESFVDSPLFRGTCYKAQGWELLGRTKGCARSRQDYYTAHGQPKQIWVRELRPGACAVLRAACLPAEFQPVEDAVIPRCHTPAADLRKLLVLCRQVPDWRAKKGRDYPLPCLLAIVVMATCPPAACSAPWRSKKKPTKSPPRGSCSPNSARLTASS